MTTRIATFLVVMVMGAMAPVRAHEEPPGPGPGLPVGTLHELRISSISSFAVAQQILQAAVCTQPARCLQNEIHVPMIINFETGVVAIDARDPRDEFDNPVPPGGPGGILFQTLSGPVELRLAPPCLNPDGCVGGEALYIGTIDDGGNIEIPSLGMDFDLFGVPPISKFRGAMGTGSHTDPSDLSVVATGVPLDFATGAVTLRGIQLVPAPIVGSVLQLNTIQGTVVPTPVPPVDAADLRRCAKAITKGSSTFARSHLGVLLDCVDRLATCEVNAETGAPDPACQPAAVALCQTLVLRSDGVRARFANQLAAACAGVGSGNLLVAAGGLGFGAHRTGCTAAGFPGTSREALLDCIVHDVACTAEEEVTRMQPRAGELLTAAGVSTPIAPTGCVTALPPGNAAGHPAKTLLTCNRALQKRLREYTTVKQRKLQPCVDAYVDCQVRAEQAGLAGAALDACRAQANLRCAAAVRTIDRTDAAKDAAIDNACAAFDVASIPALATGLGFAGLGDLCGALTPPGGLGSLDGLMDCLDRSLDCSVEGLVRRVAPRASEVLTGVSVPAGDMLTMYPCLVPQCGDGIIDATEECDPLFDPGQTCNADCTLVVCGDGAVEGTEECDDGNTTSGDGCDATCVEEPSTCGNGIVEPFGGEVCDDNDTAGGDGCNADCGSNETCGNGVVDTIRGETCDDGGTAFVASLDGAQEAPPVATAATGSATITLNPDDSLTYTVLTSGLVGTDAHIHVGAPGVAGGILIPLVGGPTIWAGTTVPLTLPDLARLRAGGLYVNVHTATNPSGEIRGQIGFATPVGGDGCSANCRSTESCGNSVVDVVTGEGCDDGNVANGDGCDATCQLDACAFISSGAPIGSRTFSVDPASGGLFSSLLGFGTPVGTVGFTSGAFSLSASATDAAGIATVTLAGDVIVGIPNLGGNTICMKFEAASTTGSLHCCGGRAVDTSFTRDSNTGGIPTTGAQRNGPSIVLSGVGGGRRGDLAMAFRVREATAPQATPADCLTATYGGVSTQVWTSGRSAARVVRPLQGGLLEFAFTGQAFDCATWTTENASGSFVRSDVTLDAVPNALDSGNLRILDDQAGD